MYPTIVLRSFLQVLYSVVQRHLSQTVEATDLSGIVIFSISGNELEITSSGILTFVNAPDYETKSIYTADVIANDGENSTTQSITVNVIDVLENDGNPPVITNLTASPSTVDVTNEAATITLTVDISDESGDGGLRRLAPHEGSGAGRR